MRASFVEIPAVDLDRAVAFYRAVFDAHAEMTVIDGHRCARFTGTGEGAEIALMHGESYVPSIDGTRIYLTVTDLTAVLRLATEHGGQVLYPATEVADGLIVAEVRDSEGNRIAVSTL